MAYDPTLASFIVVAVVGGAAAVMNVSGEWELGHELSRATDRWTKVEVLRTYPASAKPDLPGREAAILEGHGYVPLPDHACGPRRTDGRVLGGTAVCFRRARTA